MEMLQETFSTYLLASVLPNQSPPTRLQLQQLHSAGVPGEGHHQEARGLPRASWGLSVVTDHSTDHEAIFLVQQCVLSDLMVGAGGYTI